MARARAAATASMGGMASAVVLADHLELRSGPGADTWAWDLQGRAGSDTDKLWFKTEGEGRVGRGPDDAEVQALWSHAVGPWFDAQAGLRQELSRGADRTQIALGVQGLAPYMFDIDLAAFLSAKGELTARLEAEYDQRITQRLVLQPRVEANLSAQDIPEMDTGTGLTSLRAGLRLRYEFLREFAPYVGLEWQRDFGRAARYARRFGERADKAVVVIGVRAWL